VRFFEAGCEATGAEEAFRLQATEKQRGCAPPCALTVASVDIDGDYTETWLSIDANRTHPACSASQFYENKNRTSLGCNHVGINRRRTIASC